MRNFGAWKKRIRIVILTVLALDAALAAFNWWVVGATPESQKQELGQLRELHQKWQNDIQRASDIRSRLAGTEAECNRFFEGQFLDEGISSSALVEDLNSIAAGAGLRPPAVNYKYQELEKRNVREVAITATVDGSYANIVRFVRGLERSERFYLMDHLALASAQGGELKLNLQLKTYLRMHRK